MVLPTPFLDISDRVNVGGGNGEGGLLGLAFPSDYGSTRAFYVYYTTSGSPLTSRISRFRANSRRPERGRRRPGAGEGAALVDQPYINHNGGTIAFGPDGKLYMGFGDGGDGGDPQDRAQRPTRCSAR